MQLGHAAIGEDAVQGVEHQPGLGHLEQRLTQVGVLSAGIHLQGEAAQRQKQRARQGQQYVEHDRHRRVQLAVAFEVADVLMQLGELAIQVAAAPQQHANQQQQRQKQQRPFGQTCTQLAQVGAPGQFGNLPFEQARHGLDPLQIQRLVAGDPEHLLVEGGAQGFGGGFQLLLIQLQGDRLIEQGVQLTVKAVDQLAAGVGDGQQIGAQGLVIGLVRLGAEQVVDIHAGVVDGFALLVELELVQAQVGDLVGQVAVDLQRRQGLLLLIEDAREQQAALQHADLFFQGLVALAQAVELLLGLQIQAGQFIEPIGGAQQVIGELQVDCAFLCQQAVGAGLFDLT